MDNQIGIIIITKQNNIEKTKRTLKNLFDAGVTNEEYIVAINNENADEMEKYCIDNKIPYYVYTNEKEIYFELPNNLNCAYISFTSEGDIYTKNFKSKLLKHIKNNIDRNIFIYPILYQKEEYVLNAHLKKGTEVNIEENPSKIWINVTGCLIKKEILKCVKVLNNNYELTSSLITKLISINGGYNIIRNVKLNICDMLEDSKDAKSEQYDRNWYFYVFDIIKELKDFSIKSFNCKLYFIQYVICYMIKIRINCNVNMKDKHILNEEEIKKFYKEVKEVLQDIDDQIIINISGNKSVNYYLLRLKYDALNKEVEYKEFLNDVCVIQNNQSIFSAEKIKIKILLMEYVDGTINITATYPLPFDENKLTIYAKYNEEWYKAQKNYLYSSYKAFGKTLYENYTFDIKIPLKSSNEKKYIEFYLKTNISTVKLDINFNKPLSKLVNNKYAYWNVDRYTLNYRKKSILIMPRTAMRTIKREVKYLKVLLKNKKTKKYAKLRLIYFLTRNFYKKQIWLFEDKLYKGGDNGEYLYTYSKKQKDGIKKYYILNRNSVDINRFKKENKKYVKYGSLKHKLLFLNSNIVFQTHNNVTKQHSFDENAEKYFRDLFNSTNVCIQHGLTVQYIPHLTNRINDNLKQFFLASPLEKKNMLHEEYAYGGHEDILTITGSPRYDGLHNNDKKQILITPTWRSYLALPSVKYGESRRHNDNFKDSDYFKIYNNLINNNKLIEKAKETGYKIIYLLHPCTSSQINDYDKNEYVELIAATENLNYEKILTESSLMVTDYSGVQFDFAYMYKPIVYFHPKELPPSYEEGEYKYETMALGEIVNNSEELVDKVCEYMDNECKIKDEYKSRIDKFFKYHDYNNCERIYNEIMKEFYKK